MDGGVVQAQKAQAAVLEAINVLKESGPSAWPFLGEMAKL